MIEALQQFCMKRMGLRPDLLSQPAWEKIVKERMIASLVTDINSYYRKVCSSPEEEQALTEFLVVPETWFFREEDAFRFLREYVRVEWKNKAMGRRLRLLSLPCATGEEPYSMAMTLLDAGMSSNQFTIDGMDISQQGIDRAKKGYFGKRSFRGRSTAFLNRYFKEGQLNPEIAKEVLFSKQNLLSMPKQPPYDVVFCRNLLIYFGDQEKERALLALDTLLAEDGLLFVAPAEVDCFRKSPYEVIRYRGVTVLRKGRR